MFASVSVGDPNFPSLADPNRVLLLKRRAGGDFERNCGGELGGGGDWERPLGERTLGEGDATLEVGDKDSRSVSSVFSLSAFERRYWTVELEGDVILMVTVSPTESVGL